jgi:hypothetical protein
VFGNLSENDTLVKTATEEVSDGGDAKALKVE